MRSTYVPLRLTRIQDETPDAYTLFFEKPEDPRFQSYKAGQYLTFKAELRGESLRRAFSLSSSPLSDSELSVTIKRIPGGRVSNHFYQNLKPGDSLEALPPMGNFSVETDPSRSRHYILIGAGSGITPLMSIIKTVLEAEPQSKLSLWYCNRDEESIIFRRQLDELAARYPERLSLYYTLTRPSDSWKGAAGRLDTRRIYELVSRLFMEDEHEKQYYLCGPSGLIADAETALDRHAVNPDTVHLERYAATPPTEAQVAEAYPDPAEGPPLRGGYELVTRQITVELDGKSHTLEVDPRESILDAAIEGRLDPPYACQSGICTTCRAMLKSGVVSLDETEGLSEEELKRGFILTCQAHPLSDGIVIEYC